ncbi:MAG TPA: XdhC family protein [Longimicrobiales bacterium]|nr:XdhC family protein [Longimicrobiales bacterium]
MKAQAMTDGARESTPRPLDASDEARAVLRAIEAGQSLAVVTRIEGEWAGARLMLDESGAHGSLGDAELDAAAVRSAMAARAAPSHQPETLTLGSVVSARVLLEVHRPAPELFVIGAGHISVPLARIARIAGFRITVLDDREDFADPARFPDDARVLRMELDDPFARVRPDARAFVVLVTRAHRHDFDCLRRLLEFDPAPRYIGMIGSRRRVRAAIGALLEGGVSRESIARVRAPLGLGIGAETPEEIAVSVVAEMIAERHAALDRPDAGSPLSTREHILERFFPIEP